MEKKIQIIQNNSSGTLRPSVTIMNPSMEQTDRTGGISIESNAENYAYQFMQPTFAMENVYGHYQSGIRSGYPIMQPTDYPTISNGFVYNQCNTRPGFQPLVQPNIYPVVHRPTGTPYWYNPRSIQQPMFYPAPAMVPIIYPGMGQIYAVNQTFDVTGDQEVNPQRMVQRFSNPLIGQANNNNSKQTLLTPPLITSQQNTNVQSITNPLEGQKKNNNPQSSYSHTMITSQRNADVSDSSSQFMAPMMTNQPAASSSHAIITSERNVDVLRSSSPFMGLTSANQPSAVPVFEVGADYDSSENSEIEFEGYTAVDMKRSIDEHEQSETFEVESEFELDKDLSVSSIAGSDWSTDKEFESDILSDFEEVAGSIQTSNDTLRADEEFESGAEPVVEKPEEMEQHPSTSNKAKSKTSSAVDEKEEKIILTPIASNFHDEKGFVYSRSNFTKTNSYFRCKHSRKYHCLARVIATGGDLKKAVLTYEHSHKVVDDNEDELNDIKFNEKLNENSQNCFLLPREIYHNTKLELMKQGNVKSPNLPLQRNKNSFIYRRRRKQIPLLPKTVESFEKMISDPKYNKYYTTDFTDMQFYRGVWKTKSNENNVAFISQTVLEKFNTLKDGKMRADGTFRALPKHMKFCQLYIISIIYRDRSFPLAYILMQKRNFRSYSTVFTQIKSLLKVNVIEIMADYEAATRKAIRKHFPESRLAGCFFHYCQAIRKNAKRFGLSKDIKFSNVVKETSALALLPENFIASGFRYIRKQLPKSFRWNRFTSYWQRQWLNANISVFDLVDRTNNYAETFNKSINTLLKSRHPNIWILIHNLKKIEMDYSAEISKVAKGLMIPKERSQYMKQLDKQIKSATATFIETKDIQRFLENVTYEIHLDLYLKERVNVNNEDEDDQDNGSDEEEIIPNDFRKTSNLVQKKPQKILKRKCEEATPQTKRVKGSVLK